MIVACHRCKERLPEAELRAHTLDECRATARTHVLLEHGYRPFPVGHTLPGFLAGLAQPHVSRGAWEGEPRAEQPMLPRAELQFWLPRWVDIVVELWVGSIYLEDERSRRAQRDAVLRQLMLDRALQVKVVGAYTEDLRAVRDLLKRLIVGPPPMLLSEKPSCLG